MKTISNKQLTIQVSPHGAELCSIFANGKNICGKPILLLETSLSCPIPHCWERMGNEYRNEGIPYTLTQHGFARDMEFTIVTEKRMKCVTVLSAMKRLCRNTLFHSVWK